MNSELSNPWIDRFTALLDRAEIRRRARVSAQPLTGLCDLPIEVACRELHAALSRVFVPTDRCCEILQRFIEIAVWHSKRLYPDRLAFQTACYGTKFPDCSMPPVCLTGPSGSGKTELIKALMRILPPDSSIRLEPGDTEFPLVASWNISIQAHTGHAQMLSQVSPTGYTYSTESLRKYGFQSGVSLLTADEFQCLTQSTSANTLVTQRLIQLTYLHLPLIYVANYSLAHRLMRRFEEDIQRLLTNPIVLEAELPNSGAWYEILSESKVVGQECLDLNPDRDSDSLHSYTAGLKRLNVHLLVGAYRIAREDGRDRATPDDFERAYCSTAYTAERKIAKTRIQQWIEGRQIQADLWCPFDLPPSTVKQFADHAKAMRANKTAETLLKSSMTAKERRAYKELSTPKKKSKGTSSADVGELAKQSTITSSDLLRNANAFQEQFDQEK